MIQGNSVLWKCSLDLVIRGNAVSGKCILNLVILGNTLCTLNRIRGNVLSRRECSIIEMYIKPYSRECSIWESEI